MIVQARVISLVKQQQTICQITSEKSTNNVSNQLKNNDSSMEDEVKDYIRFISDENFECACPLLFWKLNEN
jgi:hypothetical protein